MGTGFTGTFAVAWAATETDGVAGATPEHLAVGSSWIWYGRALRIDGPQDLLVLDRTEEQDDLGNRAARRVARLNGMPEGLRSRGAEDSAAPRLRGGFTVTDGRRSFGVVLLGGGAGQPLLAGFPGLAPPPGVELWVTAMNDRACHEATPDRRGVICFAAGTRLLTPSGERLIEELAPGDRVITRDDGAQEVQWIGSTRVSGARLMVQPELQPIRLAPDALGRGQPGGALLLSRRHRVLLRGRAARDLFNTDEVFAAAGDLVNDHSIRPLRNLRSIAYYHLLLPRHQVVWANGIPCESFHPADMAPEMIEVEQRCQLHTLFPRLGDNPDSYGAPARRRLSPGETAMFLHDRRPLPVG